MFLYHRVPEHMEGDVLYPLNRLLEVKPQAYHRHVLKYQSREALMETRIELLDCRWSDVIFMTAVPPEVFCEAYYGAGFPRRRAMRFFRIDPARLDRSNMAVLTTMEINEPYGFAPFTVSDLAAYSKVPQKTYEYWAREQRKGNDRPFLWMHVPHILYKGAIDTQGLQVLDPM